MAGDLHWTMSDSKELLLSALKEANDVVSLAPGRPGEENLKEVFQDLQQQVNTSVESGDTKGRVRILNDVYRLIEKGKMRIATKSEHQSTRQAVRDQRDAAVAQMKNVHADQQAAIDSEATKNLMLYGGIGAAVAIAIIGIIIWYMMKRRRALRAKNFIVNLEQSQSIPTAQISSSPSHPAASKLEKS